MGVFDYVYDCQGFLLRVKPAFLPLAFKHQDCNGV